MHWDDLRIFLAAARASSLGTAAVRLSIDATTVGRRLQRLARALDSSLFETGPAGLTLTEHGRRLLVHAEAVEKAMEQAKETLTGERAQFAGVVRISLSEGFTTWFVARHLAEFHTRHPHIRVELVTTNGFLNPSKREADLAILLARPARGQLVVRKLTDYSLRLYGARAYLAAHGEPRLVADLRQHALIGYIPDFIYADELRYLREIDEMLEPQLSSSSINAQLALTRAASGLCMLPCFMADAQPDLVAVLPDLIAIRRSFWLAVHKDVRNIARIDAFIDWLSQLVVQHRSLLLGDSAISAAAG